MQFCYQISECANFTLPFNYSEPTGAQFSLFVKRTRTSGATRALFIIPGGPGESGARVDDLVPLFRNGSLVSVAYDVYQIDHRGTGRSLRLGCVDNAADSAGSCVDELQSNFSSWLPHVTVSNAARDYFNVISYVQASEPTPTIVLYAGSYGTFLSNRILTLYPTAVSAVILDGIVAGSSRVRDQDVNMNTTAMILASGCDADPVCRGYLGGNSFDKLSLVLKNFTTLECTKFATLIGFTTTQFRPLVNGIVLDPITRNGLFPLLYRILRCNADDQNRIFSAVRDLTTVPPFAVGPQPDPYNTRLGYSRALFNHIMMSELLFPVGTSETKAQLDAITDTVPAGNYEPGKLAQVYPSWAPIRYATDEYAAVYANVDIPVLLLNGQMDGATGVAWARHARQNGYTKAAHRLIEVPEAGHITLIHSPVNDSVAPCGYQIVASFLNQANYSVSTVSTACLNSITRTDFAATSNSTLEYVRRLFGTADPWGQIPAPVAAAPKSAPTTVTAPTAPRTPAASAASIALSFAIVFGSAVFAFMFL